MFFIFRREDDILPYENERRFKQKFIVLYIKQFNADFWKKSKIDKTLTVPNALGIDIGYLIDGYVVQPE